jgi:type IV fimbrial biogenesis protein FimT
MNTMRAHRRPAGGYTIIELMVVVAIVAIVIVFGIPSYRSVTTQNRMAGVINDIATDVELARSAAIKQGLPVTICPSANASTPPAGATPSCSDNANWSTGWIVFIDPSGNHTFNPDSGDTLLRAHAGFQGTDTLTGSFSDAATGPFAGEISYLTFNRMGGTSINNTTNFAALSLHDAGNTLAWRRCLVVSYAGMGTVQTQSTNAGVCP